MAGQLILASGSPRRRELLEKLGLKFRIVTPDGVDESTVGGSAFDLCQELARRKAEWVLGELDDPPSDCSVVGSDTVVALVSGRQEQVLGKPTDATDAARMLRLLSGATHRVLSGIAVARPQMRTRVEIEVTQVTFRDLDDAEIAAWIGTGEAADKAGAYAIQSPHFAPVESIRGCYYNVIGFPITLLTRMLDLDIDRCCGCASHELQRATGGCEAREIVD